MRAPCAGPHGRPAFPPELRWHTTLSLLGTSTSTGTSTVPILATAMATTNSHKQLCFSEEDTGSRQLSFSTRLASKSLYCFKLSVSFHCSTVSLFMIMESEWWANLRSQPPSQIHTYMQLNYLENDHCYYLLTFTLPCTLPFITHCTRPLRSKRRKKCHLILALCIKTHSNV